MSDPNPVVTPEEQVSPAGTSFGDILSQFEQEHQAKPGEALHGTVVAVSDEAVVVDIGRKTEGVLSPQDVRDKAGDLTIQKGDTVLVTITGFTAEGYYQLSTIKVERPKDWTALQAAFDEKRAIGGRVLEQVKGGFRVDVGVPAFMPASRSGVREETEMEALVGKDIQCRVIKLDTAEEDVVVDRRVVIEEEEKRSREERFAQLNEGDVVDGTVRNVTEFGAFVDLGGVDGLLHVTDMSWRRVGKPSDIVSPGERIPVKVLKVNRDTRKISLGLKQLTPEPWTQVADKFKTGDRVRGTVSRLAEFGAFVELEAGIDGLIHVSELSWSKKVRKPSDVLKPGESVEVVVLGVNPAEKRISLGLKQALGDPWDEAQKKFPVGAVVDATVTSLQKFGAFVDIGDEIEGLIHIGDISREKRLNHPNEVLTVGQKVRAQVLEADRERRRLRLGLKQLEPTSADQYMAEHQVGDVVTGRAVDVSTTRAKVELGEGVHGTCKIAAPPAKDKIESERSADISSLTAMLAAKWKSGPSQSTGGEEVVKAGQVRSFRIVGMDPATKRIDLEVA
jgi:small subunit ribosomal protein S1